jgi:alginate O-acetyltransferase complex protein AlgI
MVFSSITFLFYFLPIFLAAYFITPTIQARNIVTLLFSLVFYAWGEPRFVIILLISIIFNFCAGLLIDAREGSSRRWALAVAVAGNLLVLGIFKYANFITANLTTLLHPLGAPSFRTNIALPLGISFFTFQKIAYLVDASRGEVAEHDFLEYCFFVMFFPQLLAGPITHHREIFAQVKGPWAFMVKPDNLMLGLTIFVIGLFKKVVLADNFAPYVTPAFDAAAAGEKLDFFLAWQGAVAFKFQLYFDFSGYSEMALGAARLFGVQLPLNFNSPYRALNVTDFWRRWHMTLSRFLRDYIYIPLGGSRRGTARLYLNLMITLTISGLWHGAAWHFALWGAVQGGAMVLNHAWRSVWRPIHSWWSHTIARLVTFFGLTAVLVLHRAPSTDIAFRVYRGMLDLPTSWRVAADSEQLHLVAWMLFWLAVVWFLPNTQQLLARWHPAYNYGIAERERDLPLVERIRIPASWPMARWRMEWRPNAIGAAFIGILVALACLNLSHVSEFLYFRY